MSSPRYNDNAVHSVIETDQMAALRECSVLLDQAAESLFGYSQIKLFNKIKGLQGEVDCVRQQLLIPPAP